MPKGKPYEDPTTDQEMAGAMGNRGRDLGIAGRGKSFRQDLSGKGMPPKTMNSEGSPMGEGNKGMGPKAGVKGLYD